MALLIIGLGNPGPEYNHTRHNLGARVVEAWEKNRGDIKADILLPTTFMNDSGQAVAQYLKNKSWQAKDILIVHDDVELPLGQWKIKIGGTAAGHKGVRSIHQALGTTDIPRLRIGINKPGQGELTDYVLAKFTPAEEEILDQIFPKLLQAITDYCLASEPKIINT